MIDNEINIKKSTIFFKSSCISANLNFHEKKILR